MREFRFRPSLFWTIAAVVAGAAFGAWFAFVVRMILQCRIACVDGRPNRLSLAVHLFAALMNLSVAALGVVALVRRARGGQVLRLSDGELVVPDWLRADETHVPWAQVEEAWLTGHTGTRVLHLRALGRHHLVRGNWLPSRADFDAVVAEVARRIPPSAARKLADPSAEASR